MGHPSGNRCLFLGWFDFWNSPGKECRAPGCGRCFDAEESVTFGDILRLSWQAVWFHRQRSLLTMLGILIGIASVILLTSIGEGTRSYVMSEFLQFGSTLVQITPGKMQTSGAPGALGATINPLTVDDALA